MQMTKGKKYDFNDHSKVFVMARDEFSQSVDLAVYGTNQSAIKTDCPPALVALRDNGTLMGKAGDTFVYPAPDARSKYAMIVGFGKFCLDSNYSERDFNALLAFVRNQAAVAVRKAYSLQLKSVAFYDFPPFGSKAIDEKHIALLSEALAEGALLGQYGFKKTKSTPNAYPALDNIYILWDAQKIASETIVAADKWVAKRSAPLARAMLRTRELINETPNIMTPAMMAECAKSIAANSDGKIKCTIYNQPDKPPLKQMGAYLGVAQGSANLPHFIELTYQGARQKGGAHLFIIGKSITFDTGGLSLKPAVGMRGMKADMSGGAAVLAAIEGIATLGINLNVTALSLACENMPGGKAQRPGDVVQAMDGTFVEVDNTDAEGRLTLADAITYAKQQGATHIIDVATLTGAMRIALGYSYGGGYSNNTALMQLVVDASHQCGEPIWPMPLDDNTRQLNISDVADIRNTGDRAGYAGAGSAAAFIEHFVGDTPWVHLDIAGTSMTPKTQGIFSIGATGVAARTLMRVAEDFGSKITSGEQEIKVAYWPSDGEQK